MPTNNQLPNFINGAWQESAASESRPIFDPATGELWGQTPLSPPAEVDAAAEAAAIAFENFRSKFNPPLGIEAQGFCMVPKRS